MREVEVELPDEFGGYILTGATCYTTFPSCKMAVYATVSVELICFCGADINADNNIGHSRYFFESKVIFYFLGRTVLFAILRYRHQQVMLISIQQCIFFGNPRRTRSIIVYMILTEYFEKLHHGNVVSMP